MKLAIIILGILFSINCIAQPITNSAVLVSLDLDDSGNPELTFEVESTLQSEEPESWEVSLGLIPVGDSRILRRNGQRINFDEGDVIGPGSMAVTNEFPRPPRPPLLSYSVSFLNYSAVLLEEWRYQMLPNSTFGSDKDVIVGFRIILEDGPHYGWLRFARDFADDHSPFALEAFSYHPVPGDTIKAGEPPPLPAILTSNGDGRVGFSWDSRWGNLVLETTTNLVQNAGWEEIGESSGGPLFFSEDDELRFFRLKRP